MQRAEYYSHSGMVGFTGPLFMTAFGLVAGVVGGAIYAFAVYHSPEVNLSFLYLSDLPLL